MVTAGRDTVLDVALREGGADLDAVIVSATRTDRRIEDVPLRVEVLEREEVEEKMLMTPGDVSMMLNETSGLRVQTTSPSLGGANVRVQGLRGRYTQILSDGLPLYGGQTGSLGLLQIPPMDLGQVEIIKGAASALYGASALGGVINLVSRRPGDEAERELLVNGTTRGGADLVGYAAERLGERWGYSALVGAHAQPRVDIDGDGWTDMAGYRRAVVRPRLFWTGERGRSALLTLGSTVERRDGGTLAGATAPDGDAYSEALRTERLDAAAVTRLPFARSVLTVRGSASTQVHRHRFGAVRERDRHDTWFGETALATTRGVYTAVVGAAFQWERYRSRDVAGFDYAYSIPAAFAHYDVAPRTWLSLSASARADAHSAYGTFVNPRVSLLLRPLAGWTARLSGGTGAFAPTPFTDETEVTGLAPVVALRARTAERARGASLDLGGAVGAMEVNVTLFASRIRDAVAVRTGTETGPSSFPLEIVNATGPTRTGGAELLARYRVAEVVVTGSYTRTRSTEQDPERPGARREVPLTPAGRGGRGRHVGARGRRPASAWSSTTRARRRSTRIRTGRRAGPTRWSARSPSAAWGARACS
jgi:iron complex outermembrane receptor protein